MGSCPKGEKDQSARPQGRLAVLTWTLLALLAVWGLVWLFFQRPTTEERRQIEAFRLALDYVPAAYLNEVDRDELFRAGMTGMMEALEDRYSAYVTPEDNQRLREQTSGQFVGVGVTITQRDGLPLVIKVHAGGPAERGGLKRGDLITHVDGEEIKGQSLEEVVSKIRGKLGTEVSLGLRRTEDGSTYTATLKRERIDIEVVQTEMLEDGIGVIRLASFDRHSGREMERGLRELAEQGLAGLVVDLRDNSGGLVDQAIRVCDLFLDEGLILSIRGRPETPIESVKATAKLGVDGSVPIVVLVDEGTASAAEILSGALQAHGRATIMGAKTVGKGSVTNVRPLPDGSALVVTVARYELAGGKTVEGQGILPDIVVGEVPAFPESEDPEEVREWVRAFRSAKEEQFKAALEFIKEKVGDAAATPDERSDHALGAEHGSR